MAELAWVRQDAAALIRSHLGDSWSFAFDSAKTRAGQCDYTRRRITVSRHLAARYPEEEVHQVLLHEVAHALAGSAAAHGPAWKRTAAGLGYEGRRLHAGVIATDLAPWIGTCPRGHEHFRYRTPTRTTACGQCSRRFDTANLITWQRREVAARRPAVDAG